MTRVVLLTGNKRRHRYAASRLAERLDLAGVLTEEKRPPVAVDTARSASDDRDIQKHLAQRDEAEANLLGNAQFPDVPTRAFARDGANSPEALAWVSGLAPDLVLLYGTSIIREPFLSHFERRVVNLHLGLSPYYRGAGTNFWPFVDGRPECVGATIHLAVAAVDAGGILIQARPEPDPRDRIHEMGTKALIAGVEAMATAAHRYVSRDWEPQAQDLGVGRVYRQRDFNAEALRAAWARLDAGLMERYCKERDERERLAPIVRGGPR